MDLLVAVVPRICRKYAKVRFVIGNLFCGPWVDAGWEFSNSHLLINLKGPLRMNN